MLDEDQFTTPCPSCGTDTVEIRALQEIERNGTVFDAYNRTKTIEATLTCASCKEIWHTQTPCEISYGETRTVCEDAES
ncbi:MAG: hypothetical protein J07HQX50_01714 [Haloquadratum sp. J07HQX50]|jgi:hypothetical protein|nr:MAG: hypothetical protein J07HQX50_01714 [Haloquadratum sp. J07HQX50]